MVTLSNELLTVLKSKHQRKWALCIDKCQTPVLGQGLGVDIDIAWWQQQQG